MAVQETLSDIELYRDLEEEPDYPAGYLSEVPFLEQVPLQVQVDLLAETWNRHQQAELIEASLLDAAIVYAACQTAARIIEDMREVAAAYFRDGPRQLKTRILRRAAHRLKNLFDAFWDDDDFLLLDELQDLPPDRSAQAKFLMRIADEDVQLFYDALARWHVSPNVAANLQGLLTEAEIVEAMPLLTATSSATNDTDTKLLNGIDDSYHGLTVGPCDPETAAAEASKCPFVCEIGVTDAEDFECSYQEWVEQLRDAAHRAAVERDQSGQEVRWTGELMKQVHVATTAGLDDGTRIERQQNGWVVVDRYGYFLMDPEDAAWVADADDEDMPALVFGNPEEAYVAYLRSCAVGDARERRRDEALKRLGRV
ncbi:MAG: hypothetical protein NTY19_08285 [Planctomycetota bacterium]|nr:hypothetical protein [Planctomycetota bacterium]